MPRRGDPWTAAGRWLDPATAGHRLVSRVARGRVGRGTVRTLAAALWTARVLAADPEPPAERALATRWETAAANVRPTGEAADGVRGDFVLQNDRITAVIAGPDPNRKANVATFWSGSSSGCLIDLALRAEASDQLGVFSPCGQEGAVSSIGARVATVGGVAVVEVEVGPELGAGLSRRHEYRLAPGGQGVEVRSRIRNEGAEPRTVSLADRWASFPSVGECLGIRWADAPDPAQRVGYAQGMIGAPEVGVPAAVELHPGQAMERVRFIAVGRSPAEAWGLVAAQRGAVGQLRLRVLDARGAPVPEAAVLLRRGGGVVPGYPDPAGGLDLSVPPGVYQVEGQAAGRAGAGLTVEVGAGRRVERELRLGPASGVAFDIRDARGCSLPCKVQFIGRGETADPDLGPPTRARGCRNQYVSETGVFEVALGPGRYGVLVTRGPEYSHLVRAIEVAAGSVASVTGRLERLVDTRGWISADLHSHSMASGDSVCRPDDRLISLAAEGVEFSPSTEHDRILDWGPHLRRLGLTNWLATVPGVELTAARAHFNAFPFEADPSVQGGGAPGWGPDPVDNVRRLRAAQRPLPGRYVQLNHPDVLTDLLPPESGGAGLGSLVDAAEIAGGVSAGILVGAPVEVRRDDAGREAVRPVHEFRWLQLLNLGHRVPGVAGSDAHSVHGDGVGGWRTYVPSETDDPAHLDWDAVARALRAGRSFLTTGPFLEVRTAGGAGPGDTVSGPGPIELHVRVQCSSWLEIDRVQVLVNGRPRRELNFTRAGQPEAFGPGVVKFDRRLRVELNADAHVIVVALGERFDLSTGFGSSPQAALKPCAFNNPIFVDLEGNGFQPSGDTLGWPVALPHLSVEEAKAWIAERGRAGN